MELGAGLAHALILNIAIVRSCSIERRSYFVVKDGWLLSWLCWELSVLLGKGTLSL